MPHPRPPTPNTRPRTTFDRYLAAFDDAATIPDLFELVKRIVEDRLGYHRAGLMLGFTDLGFETRGFIGAYFQTGGNAIIVNRRALEVVVTNQPRAKSAYLFYLLLHEYLHACGIIDETVTRKTAARVCNEVFGAKHMVTRIASDFGRFFQGMVAPPGGVPPPKDAAIELVRGFDRSSVTYIH